MPKVESMGMRLCDQAAPSNDAPGNSLQNTVGNSSSSSVVHQAFLLSTKNDVSVHVWIAPVLCRGMLSP